jgi:hypothetical protein
MGKDVVAKQSNLPAHLQAAANAREQAKEFSGGVQSGFPVLSYRGKTWRVKQGGEEQVYTDAEGDAIQAIQVVLVASNVNLSKTYYAEKYAEGSNAKPDCYSADGIKPDPSVHKPICASCKGCPMNAWGSRQGDEGQKQKACADVRRMAVIMDHELEAVAEGEKDITDADVLLLRVPGGSLNPLKDYVEDVLLPKGGLLPYMLVTRVGFDSEAAYPRFTFKAKRFLDEDEFGTVEALRESSVVKRIINEVAEHDDGGTTEDDDDEPSTDHDENGEVIQSAPPKSSDEEDHFSEPVDDDEIAPPPKKKTSGRKRAAQVEEEAIEDDDEIAPPPKKANKKKKEVVEEPEAESPGEDDLDAMLDGILG